MIHLFKSAVSKLWLLLVVLLILTALGVAAARAFLPALDGYDREIEAMAGELLGVPVRLQGVGARLSGFTPEVVLRRVVLVNPDTGKPAMSLAGMRLGVDLLGSLTEGELRFKEVTLFGARLTLVRGTDGSVVLEGIRTDIDSFSWREVAALLPHGIRIRIVESELVWENQAAEGEGLLFEAIDLNLANDGRRYRLDGSLRVRGAAGAGLKIAAELREDSSAKAGWTASVRLYGQRLPLAELSRGWSDTRFAVAAGLLELDVRARLDGAVPAYVAGSLAVDGLELTDPQGIHTWRAKRLAGEVRWRKLTAGWDLGVRRFLLERGERQWPPAELALRFDDAGVSGSRLIAGASFLRMDDLTDALRLSPFADGSLGSALVRIAPGGDLRDFQVRASFGGAEPAWEARGRVDGLRAEAWGELPGVEGIGLNFWGNQRQGGVLLDSGSSKVQIPGLLREPLRFDRIGGMVAWRQEKDGELVLESGLLEADTPYIKTRSRLKLELPPEGGSPFLDLQTDFRDGDAAGTPHYLPVGIMPPKLVEWLDRAIVSGRVSSGSALVRGRLADFPFSNDEGRFEVLFGVEDLILDYHEGWPRLEGIAAETCFLDNSLSIHAVAGDLLESRLEDAEAGFQSLYPASPLEVSGSVTGPFRDALRVLGETPLSERFGALSQVLRADGESHVQLAMSLPLDTPEATRVKGDISWREAGLYSKELDVALSRIVGTLSFTENGASGSGIKAEALGVPVTIEAAPLPPNKGRSSGTRMTLRGAIPIRALADNHNLSGLDYLSGTADWTFSIDVSLQKNGRLPPRRVTIASSLEGVGIALPMPLGKPAAESRAFRLVGELSDRPEKRLDVRYGKDIRAELIIGSDAAGGTVLRRGQVRFGEGEAGEASGEGLQLVGSMERLELDPWMSWLDPGQVSHPVLSVGDLLRYVDVKIGELSFRGRTHEQVELRIARSPKTSRGWQGEIKTSRLAAKLQLPESWAGDSPLVLDFSFLDLKLGADDKEPEAERLAAARSAALDPREFPALRLDIEDLRTNGESFGSLHVRTQKTGAGSLIDKLRFLGAELELDGQGSWLVEDGTPKSRLQVTARSPKPGRLIRRFGFDTNIEARSADLEAKLEWPGGPLDAGLRDLKGEFDIHIARGRFLDVDPGLGRVFGLLSLGALQRRLTLDFTDTFGKGFAFDRIEGSFRLDDGNAYTTDSYLEGPSARLDIAGRTGLVSRDYDQYVTVTPRVSTSIPLAAALAVSPPIGAAVLVAQQLVGKELDKITRYHYEVVGPWDAPEITSVKLRDQGSEPSPGFLDGDL